MKFFIKNILAVMLTATFLSSLSMHVPVPREQALALLRDHHDELRSLMTQWDQENSSKENCKGGLHVVSAEWLPGYLIKEDVTRVRNAEILKKIITEDELSELAVPDKFLYHVSGDASTINDKNYLVVAQRVDRSMRENQELTTTEVQQLCHLATKASYYDLHDGNYMPARDGKIYVIDTDSVAMPSLSKIISRQVCWMFFGHDRALNNHPLSELYEQSRQRGANENTAIVRRALKKEEKSRTSMQYWASMLRNAIKNR